MADPVRVVIAMSGGVDSSLAAARLVDQGHDVVGVMLHLWGLMSFWAAWTATTPRACFALQ